MRSGREIALEAFDDYDDEPTQSTRRPQDEPLPERAPSVVVVQQSAPRQKYEPPENWSDWSESQRDSDWDAICSTQRLPDEVTGPLIRPGDLPDAEWLATGDIVGGRYSLDRLTAGVCTKTGNVTFRATFICDTFASGKLCLDNATIGPFNVPAGTFRSFTRSAGIDPFTVFGDDDFGGRIQIGVGATYALVVKSRND